VGRADKHERGEVRTCWTPSVSAEHRAVGHGRTEITLADDSLMRRPTQVESAHHLSQPERCALRVGPHWTKPTRRFRHLIVAGHGQSSLVLPVVASGTSGARSQSSKPALLGTGSPTHPSTASVSSRATGSAPPKSGIWSVRKPKP